uniref:Uncharacterized protein n=1 Tax=Candidatus Methanogaster sp. ANME-2c ERB4 TaxID=2759911 RepID=A0A7G9YC27_9EURY|nr:hypothetical protein GOPIBCPI_00001 [Methanosarcinales archaeon ANME-2c ERB4]
MAPVVVRKIAYDTRRQWLSTQTHQFIRRDDKVAIRIVYPKDEDLAGPSAIVLYTHACYVRSAVRVGITHNYRIPAKNICMSSRAFGSRVYECDISLYRVIGPAGCPSHLGDRVIAIRSGRGRPEIVVAAGVYMPVAFGRRPYCEREVSILKIVIEFIGDLVFRFCPVVVLVYVV